jgi:hypothetical protein
MARMRRSTWEAISCGDLAWPAMRTQASPLGAATTRKAAVRASMVTSSALTLRPTRRLAPKMVWPGLVTAWRRAATPTSTSPAGVHDTTDGVVRSPSGDASTRGPRSSSSATHELVVPRSMPMISTSLLLLAARGRGAFAFVGGGVCRPVAARVG